MEGVIEMKREVIKEVCHQISVSRFQQVWTGCRSSILAFSFFALVIGGTPFVENAASHTEPDHEIADQTQALEEEPDRPDLWIKRSQLYRSNGNFLEALNDLDRAGELDPDNTHILLERGLTLSALGRDVEAEVELDQFLDRELNSSMVVAFAERGHIRARTGREGLAISDFTTAIHIQPMVGLYLARGQAQETLGNLEASGLGYREGLSRLGNNVLLKKALIRVETAQHRYDEALRLIDEELARVIVKSPWYLEQAELLVLKGRVQAAQRAREKALVETNRALGKRTTALHRVYRAKVYISMGRLDEAKRDLQLAVQMAPYFVEAGDLLTSLEGR